MTQPILSIIIPMRGGVPETWLKELLKVQGSVEFILVYPPGVSPLNIVDDRLRHIKIPLQGELIQRLSALLNARGTYVLSINCDEYLHHNIVDITREYFRNFPESYFFRLKQRIFEFGDPTIIQEWKPLQNLAEIKVRKTGKKPDNSQEPDYSEAEKQYMMRETPIVPLGNRFDFSAFLRGLLSEIFSSLRPEFLAFKKDLRRKNKFRAEIHANCFCNSEAIFAFVPVRLHVEVAASPTGACEQS